MKRLMRMGNFVMGLRFGRPWVFALSICGTTPSFSQPIDIQVDFNGVPIAGGSLGTQPYSRPTVICNMPGFQPVSCLTAYGFSNDQSTPFLQETVRIDGVDYYHVVVKDRSADFSTEYYIRYGFSEFDGNTFSDSGGAACFPGPFTRDVAACAQANNARNPLSPDYRISGNGTGVPDRVEMRQINNDAASGFSQEFLKNKLATKPIITQTIDTAAFTGRYVMDMSGIDYNTDTVPGVMTNTLGFKDVSSPQTLPNFDYAQFSKFIGSTAKDTPLTAGRYKFLRFPFLEPGGTYTYFDGSIDPVLNQNWAAFRDPVNNPSP